MKRILSTLLFSTILIGANAQNLSEASNQYDVAFPARNVHQKNVPAKVRDAKINASSKKGPQMLVRVLEEGFDTETFPPTDWTVTNTATTDPEQNWHRVAISPTDGIAIVEFNNPDDKHDEWLISPEMQLTNTSHRLNFNFITSKNWTVHIDNATMEVRVSIDNGVSWSDIVWTEDDTDVVDTWLSETWSNANIDLAAYNGQKIKIAFHFIGTDGPPFYAIDDVMLYETPKTDLAITDGFVRNVNRDDIQYFRIPRTQEHELSYGAVVQNIGTEIAKNVHVSSKVESIDDNDIFSINSDSIDLAPGGIDTIWTDTDKIPSLDTTYIITQTVVSDSMDASAEDDTLRMAISYFGHLYARETGYEVNLIGNVQNNDGFEFSIGNLFEVFGDDSIIGVNVHLYPLPDAVEEEMYVQVKRYNVDLGDFETIGESDIHVIQQYEIDNDMPFTVMLDEAAGVQQGDEILVLAGHLGSDNVLFRTSIPTTQGTVIGFTNASDGFNLIDPNTPIIRPYMANGSRVGVAERNRMLVEASAFPVPSKEQTTLEINLEKSEEFLMEIRSIDGKLIASENLGSLVQGVNQVLISKSKYNLSNGSYLVNLRSLSYKVVSKVTFID